MSRPYSHANYHFLSARSKAFATTDNDCREDQEDSATDECYAGGIMVEQHAPNLGPHHDGELIQAIFLSIYQAERMPMLGADSAAVWNEGFVVYSPDRVDLDIALHRAINEPMMPGVQSWHFISNRQMTVEALLSVGASSTLVTADKTACFEYLGF